MLYRNDVSICPDSVMRFDNETLTTITFRDFGDFPAYEPHSTTKAINFRIPNLTKWKRYNIIMFCEELERVLRHFNNIFFFFFTKHFLIQLFCGTFIKQVVILQKERCPCSSWYFLTAFKKMKKQHNLALENRGENSTNSPVISAVLSFC